VAKLAAWLVQGCEVLQCKIEAPRHIAKWPWTAARWHPPKRRLPFVCRASQPQQPDGGDAMVDLSLTDVSGQLVARGHWHPRTSRQFGAGAWRRLHLQVKLSSADRQINGYTVESSTLEVRCIEARD